MNGVDIFIAILCAVMFFGGLYLNIVSKKLSAQYAESHSNENIVKKNIVQNKK